MSICHIDDVDIIELSQLLLSPEGQESVDDCLSRRDKRGAVKILWGAASSRFLPETPFFLHARTKLAQLKPWE
jgi:hypothetical protein